MLCCLAACGERRPRLSTVPTVELRCHCADSHAASCRPLQIYKDEEAFKRSSWRLGGGGLATRRGSHVVEMQHAIFLQAFANAFGVRVFMLSVTGRSRKLRVVRVEPRPGRRVLINGYAVAHLGGVAFDSITRHHEVIEIQSDDDEEEEEEEEPEREPSPEPPPRKRPRRARVKTEVKAER